MLIRQAEKQDYAELLTIINQAALAYRGVIPADRWHDPYMPEEEFLSEIASGVIFWIAEGDDGLLGGMGIQDKGAVALIRHAYISPSAQRKGVGTRILRHVAALTTKPVLIGTWANATWAIDFYQRAFDAKEVMRIPAPNERIGHAEIKVGDSIIMLADEHPEMDARAPGHFGGSPVSLLLYVNDVDKQFRQALDAGGTEVRPVADQFYGDRSGALKDPFGHTWHLSTHKEDVSLEEIARRMASMKQQ